MKESRKKTIALVKLLLPNEAEDFSQRLKKKNGKALRAVFEFVRGVPTENGFTDVQKRQLFKRLYGKDFSKDQDYLIRNLLRHLSTELIDFIAEEKRKEELADRSSEMSLTYLRSLRDRKAYDLFEMEWKKVFALSLEEMNMDVAEQLQRMMIDHCVHHGAATVDSYQHLLGLIEEHVELQKRAFLHTHLHSMHMRAFSERMLQGLGNENQISELKAVSLDAETEAADDPYLSYLLLLIASYSLKGQPRIDVLSKACGFVEKINPKKKDMESALASASASIALEYFLMNEYELSLPYHEKALSYSSKLPDDQVVTFVFNHLSTLLRLERYEQGIELIDRYRSKWIDLPKMRDRFLCLNAMCHLFLGDHRKASEYIPENRKQGGMDHYYYYRFIQVIVFYTKGQLELAITEADNFEHAIRYNDGGQDAIHLTRSLLKFFALQGEKSALETEDLHERSLQMERELTEYIETTFSDHVLVYRWLIRELRNGIKGS